MWSGPLFPKNYHGLGSWSRLLKTPLQNGYVRCRLRLFANSSFSATINLRLNFLMLFSLHNQLLHLSKIPRSRRMCCASPFSKTRQVWGIFSAAPKDMWRFHDRDVGSLSIKYVWECYKFSHQALHSSFLTQPCCDLSEILTPRDLCGAHLAFQKIRREWACLRLP
jgi:hypothetical protein